MLQAVQAKPGPGEWPRIRAEDVRELIPDLDRMTEEMIEAIQCGVRYRLRQLQLLFGDALQEPGARFELEIALRARRLLGPAGQDEGLGILPRRDDARR